MESCQQSKIRLGIMTQFSTIMWSFPQKKVGQQGLPHGPLRINIPIPTFGDIFAAIHILTCMVTTAKREASELLEETPCPWWDGDILGRSHQVVELQPATPNHRGIVPSSFLARIRNYSPISVSQFMGFCTERHFANSTKSIFLDKLKSIP
jgi:hypothetical protein